jgi:hypothetical protein
MPVRTPCPGVARPVDARAKPFGLLDLAVRHSAAGQIMPGSFSPGDASVGSLAHTQQASVLGYRDLYNSSWAERAWERGVRRAMRSG